MEIGLVDPSTLLATDALLTVILAVKSYQSVRMAHKLSIKSDTEKRRGAFRAFRAYRAFRAFRAFRGSTNCLSVTANQSIINKNTAGPQI